MRRDERPGDTIPEQAGVYVPPRPLASLSEHRTMDVKAIRLAAEVDPRQALTELKLEAPRRRRAPKGWVAPIAFAVLAIGFIALWWAMPEQWPLGNAPDAVPAVAPSLPFGTQKHLSGGEVAPLGQPTSTVLVPAPAAPPPPPPLAVPANPTRPTAAPNATSPAPPAAVRAAPVPAAAPSASAPHRPKGGRDPWLE